MAIIKTLLFHVLLSFRGLILGVSKLLSFAFLGSFLAVIFFNDLAAVPAASKAMMACAGILFTAIYWFYDYLIFYLKPKMLDMMLLK